MPADLMLIGEAPGYWELQAGRPFVGRAGKKLDQLLLKASLKRADVRITNTCGCVDMSREDRRPLPVELEACAPRLEAEIEMTNPRAIVLMGNTAITRWYPGYRIGEVYNTPRVVGGRIYIPTYHPAAVLRGHPQLEPIITEALMLAGRLTA